MKLAQQLLKTFTSAYVERFPKTNNSHADALATLASVVDSKTKRTIDVEYLPRPSTNVYQPRTQLDGYHNLKQGTLPIG